jgi:FkbM family methyltransferase
MGSSTDFSLFDTLRGLNVPMPKGVLQLGASYGQELREFVDNGIQCGVFIEPLAEPYKHLSGLCKQVPNYIAVNTLCADEAGRSFRFHVASNGGMSSSILEPDKHLSVNPGVHFPGTVEVVSSTVDQVAAFLRANDHANTVNALDLLYMDCQGAEFKILQGAPAMLRQVKYIYTEAMRGSLYKDQVPFLSYCAFLDAVGFTLNDVHFDHPALAGNALFVRKDVLGLH